MKKQFKIIALILAVFNLCSVFAVSAAGDKTLEVQSYDYSAKMGLLLKLGVLKSEITDFSSSVTRGDFVEAAMRLSGYENVGLGLLPPYEDVNETDSWYGAVSSAHSLGYIDGNGKFEPKESVSFYEVADMLTAILGYVYVWDRYETKNPVMAAHRIGISDGVSLSATAAVTKGDMIKLLYNALFINVMKPTVYYYSDNFDLGSGETLLAEVFDVYKSTGIVEATPLTSIYADEGCADGHIDIGGIIYKTNESYFDFIGHGVTYFYHSYDGVNTVIYMYDKYNDSEFTVDFSDVESITETELVYTGGAKERKKTIVKFSPFLYNGKLKSFTDINKNIQSGNVKLIDSNGDGKYDVVNITEYVHGVVTGFSKGEFKVFTAQNQNFDMRAENGIRAVEIYADGKLASFDSIVAGDLISVAETSGNGMNLIRAYISKNSMEGTIMGLDDKSVKIDDTEYSYDVSNFSPQIGDYGKFHIAFNGKVVISELENYVVYGFLYGIIKKNDLYAPKAKIYSDKGRWVELEIADKVTYNGGRISAETLMSAPELLKEGNFKPQLIAYRVNSEKKLTVMDTASTVKRWSDEEKEAIENADFRYVDLGLTGTKSMYFRSNLKCFNLEAFITSDTYIFVVPGSEGDTTIDTSKVYLATSASFVGDKSYSNLNFYDMDEWGNIGAMVIYGDVAQLDRTLYPVLGTGKSLDTEGNIQNSIYIMFNGYKLDLPVDPQVNLDSYNLKAGDVIRYSSLPNGNIGLLSLDYRPDDESYANTLINGIYSANTFIAGKAERIDLAVNKILVSNGAKQYVLDISAVQNTYLFNQNKTSARKATVSDIPLGSKIYLSVTYGKVQHIVAYE
ncbi:MAG: S-layer homology domain-containing protein [Clostridia bacterium]|nr:S-layer homology domain-containing protein [Clostridia bacterium]